VLDREPVELAALLGDRDGVGPELEPARPVGGGGLQHAVARFGRPARLGDDHGEGRGQWEVAQHPVDPVRVGVVEKMRLQGVVRPAQRFGHELGSQGRPADAHHQ